MVEITKTKSVRDIVGRGYKDLGIYKKDSKEFCELIMKTTSNNIDLTLLFLNQEIYQAFIKVGECNV
ncbi:MAG: hypothetical protein WDA24_10595 [Tissierellales bacterium]